MEAIYEDKITEAKGAVNYWLNIIAPCNTSSCARGIPSQYFSYPKKRIASYQEIKSSLNNPHSEINSKELLYQFWNDVVQACKDAGILILKQTERIDEYGNRYVEVETQITDEDRYQQILEEVINRYITNPETLAHLRLGKWMKRLFIEGNLDVEVILDFEPPTIEIISPKEGSMLTGVVEIVGTATDANFVNYKLEIGAGEEPTEWKLLNSSTSPVSKSILGVWDTTGLSGVYTIRLTATDANDNTNEKKVNILVGKIVLPLVFGKKGNKNG